MLIISKGKRKQQQQQGVRERYFMVGTPREVFYEWINDKGVCLNEDENNSQTG